MSAASRACEGAGGELGDDRLDLLAGTGAVDQRAQLLRPGPRRAACRARSRAACASAGGRASSARATRTVRLPSTRSSPAGLPVTVGVAEDAEQVVAQLEGLTQRQAEAGQLLRSSARRGAGRAPRRCGAAARWSTSRTCSAARSSPCRRRPSPAPAPRRRGTARSTTSLRVRSK